MIFSPHVEPLSSLEPPPEFFSEFGQIVSRIYPQDTITKLQNDNYNPVVIGYEHDEDNFYLIMSRFMEVAISATTTSLKVALEIAPEQLGWIEEFLRDRKEYKEHGTVWGKVPTVDVMEGLRSYRSKLSQSHSQRLTLWLLENGFRVVSIEHKQIMKWINADRKQMSGSDEEWWGSGLSEFQPGYTAIRRDIYGLGVIDRERPDIISVGLYHALKYDFLLERDGKNSFYFITGNFSWSVLLNMWKKVHTLYLQQHIAAK